MAYFSATTEGAPGAPLFITFHGTGGDERQFHDFALHLVTGAHVISPRGDVNENGMNRYFRRTAEGVYDMDDLAARTETMASFIRDARRKVNPSRVIGLGYSNGANILAAVQLKHPDLVDEAVLMHPLIPWSPDPQPGLSGKRILITAGRRDPICPAPQTEALASYLEAQNVDLTVDWHEGGHEIGQNEPRVIADFLERSTQNAA